MIKSNPADQYGRQVQTPSCLCATLLLTHVSPVELELGLAALSLPASLPSAIP